MNERETIELHNRRIEQTNPPPAEVPAPKNDEASLVALIEEYNQGEAEQRDRLAKLWSSLAQRTGPRFVAFGPARKWTSNDFVMGDNERDDLRMGRSIEPFIAAITDYDLGA